MRAQFRVSDLIPAELNVEAVHHRADVIVVVAYGQSRGCRCPECGTTSHRVHSRYPRMIADLPCAGRKIELQLAVRRFVCSAVHCRRKIFAERFGDGVPIKEIVRRTGHSRKLVRSVVRGQRTDIFRVRQTSLEQHLPWLEAQWDAGLRNGAELWR